MNTKRMLSLIVAIAMLVTVVPSIGGLVAKAAAPEYSVTELINMSDYSFIGDQLGGSWRAYSWNDPTVLASNWSGWGGACQLYSISNTQTIIDAHNGDGVIYANDDVHNGTQGKDFFVLTWIAEGDGGAAADIKMLTGNDGTTAIDTFRFRASHTEGLNYHWANDGWNNKFAGVADDYTYEDGNNGVNGSATDMTQYYVVYANNEDGSDGYTASYYFREPDAAEPTWIGTKTFATGTVNGFYGYDTQRVMGDWSRWYNVEIYAGNYSTSAEKTTVFTLSNGNLYTLTKKWVNDGEPTTDGIFNTSWSPIRVGYIYIPFTLDANSAVSSATLSLTVRMTQGERASSDVYLGDPTKINPILKTVTGDAALTQIGSVITASNGTDGTGNGTYTIDINANTLNNYLSTYNTSGVYFVVKGTNNAISYYGAGGGEYAPTLSVETTGLTSYNVTVSGAGNNDSSYTEMAASAEDVNIPYYAGYVLKDRTVSGTSIALTYEASIDTLGTWAIRNNVTLESWPTEMKYLGSHNSFADTDSMIENEGGTLFGDEYTDPDDTNIFVTETAIRNASKTQISDVLEQLNAGVRYFDVRLSRQSDGSFWTVHGPAFENFRDVATTISQFAAENPGEIILLDFQSLRDALYTTVINDADTTNRPYNGGSVGDDNREAYAALVELLEETGILDYSVTSNWNQRYGELTNNGTKTAILLFCKSRGANCQPSVFINRSSFTSGETTYTENSLYSSIVNNIDSTYLNINSGANYGIIHAYTTINPLSARTNSLISSAQSNNPKWINETNFSAWMGSGKGDILLMDDVTSDAPTYLAKLSEYNRDGFDNTYTNTVSGVTIEGPTAAVPFSTSVEVTTAAVDGGTSYTFALTQFADTPVDISGAVTLTFPDATNGNGALKTVVYLDGAKIGEAQSGNAVSVTASSLKDKTYTVKTERDETMVAINYVLSSGGTALYTEYTAKDAAANSSYYYKADAEGNASITGNYIYGAEYAGTPTDNVEVVVTPQDNANVSGLYNGGTVTVDDVTYSIVSDNLIPNGTFTYGFTGYYTGSDASATIENGFTLTEAASGNYITANTGTGVGGSSSILTGYDVEVGKNYVLTIDIMNGYGATHDASQNGKSWIQYGTYTNAFPNNGDLDVQMRVQNNTSDTWETVQYVITNCDAEILEFSFRWINSVSFRNFGLYEVTEYVDVPTLTPALGWNADANNGAGEFTIDFLFGEGVMGNYTVNVTGEGDFSKETSVTIDESTRGVAFSTVNTNRIYQAYASTDNATGDTTDPVSIYSLVIDAIVNGGFGKMAEDGTMKTIAKAQLDAVNTVLDNGGIYLENNELTDEAKEIMTYDPNTHTITLKDEAFNAGLKFKNTNYADDAGAEGTVVSEDGKTIDLSSIITTEALEAELFVLEDVELVLEPETVEESVVTETVETVLDFEEIL